MNGAGSTLGSIKDTGFALVDAAVNEATVVHVVAALENRPSFPGDSGAGLRDLASTVSEIAELAERRELRGLASAVLGRAAFPVRTLFFDKNVTANWKVAWHQDLTIAVREQREVAGFGPWSLKAGIPHVQPPVAVLERMITLRLHLDDCDADNGALRVLPGSHGAGRLTAEAIRAWRERVAEVTCAVPRGGAVLMRPLLLHASAPALRPLHRRVVHIEFAAEGLPDGLEWMERGGLPIGRSNARI